MKSNVARPASTRRIATVTSAVLLAVTGIYVMACAFASPPPATVSLSEARPQFDPPAALVAPGVGHSAIGLAGADEPLGSAGGDDAIPMASITKTVTALVVLDAHPIVPGESGPAITMTEADAQVLDDTIASGGSWAPVRPGAVLDEREVLEIMLLESASNYSVTLAKWAFGSLDAYVDEANRWLRDKGLTDTTVIDPFGLDPRNRSSTADLLRIGSMVLADPLLRELVATKDDVIASIGEIQNTNRALGTMAVNGIKTGTTDEAGWCLLFSAPYTGLSGTPAELIGVVLGAPDDVALYGSVQALLASARAGLQPVRVVGEGDALARYTTAWGATADVIASEDLSIAAWSGDDVERSLEVRGIGAAESGTEVGTLRFDLSGGAIADADTSMPIVLGDDLNGPDLWWRLTHPLELLRVGTAP